MDKEEREALEMTKEELLDRAAKGTPAQVARKDPRDLDRMGKAIVDEATDSNELPTAQLRFRDPVRLRSVDPQLAKKMVKGQVTGA